MIGESIAIVGLVALAGFILWEGWRRRKPPTPVPREQMAQGFTPGATVRERLLFVVGLVLAAIAAAQFAEPPIPPFHGRSAVLGEWLHRAFGPFGIPCATAAASMMAIAAAASIRRKRRTGFNRRAPSPPR